MTIFDLSEDFKVNYMYRRLKPTTIRGYERNINAYILPFFKDEDLSAVTYSALDDFVAKITSQGLSNTSIIYVLSTLSKMYSFGVLRGYTSFNPLLTYDFPRKNNFQYSTLTRDQIDLLLNASAVEDDFPAILFACHYGLRRGECCAVKTSDIVGNILQVQRTVSRIQGASVLTTPKSDKIRFIKLLDEDLKLLSEYSKARITNADDFLIRNKSGLTVSPNAINKRLKKRLQNLHLPIVRFHDLRHSYATIMMQQGVNPKIVSTVLGHSSVDITLDLYSHCYVDMQDACLDVFRRIKR